MCNSLPGGPKTTADGQAAIQALTWTDVDEIVATYIPLNPYRQASVPGSILKIEDENYDPDTGAQREIECYSIAAKRYGLFTRDPDGRPVLVHTGEKRKRSEHGLGHLLPPNAPHPDTSDRAWLDDWWQHLLCVELGYPSDEPDWFNAPAVGRLTVTSTREMRPWNAYSADKPYGQQVKPWAFLTIAQPAPHERARRGGPRSLIAPFERDPARRLAMRWMNREHPDRPHPPDPYHRPLRGPR